MLHTRTMNSQYLNSIVDLSSYQGSGQRDSVERIVEESSQMSRTAQDALANQVPVSPDSRQRAQRQQMPPEIPPNSDMHVSAENIDQALSGVHGPPSQQNQSAIADQDFMIASSDLSA